MGSDAPNIVLAANIIIFVAFYKEFQVTTFDPGLAAALGLSPIFFNYLLMAQASSTAITSFRNKIGALKDRTQDQGLQDIHD